MREEIAEIVHPVFYYGLSLVDQLNANIQLDFYQVQQDVIRLLKSENEARRWPDYGRSGSPADASVAGMTMAGRDPQRLGPNQFLGIRYALVCWLDELMVETSWGPRWKESTLESQLFTSRDRSWMFWEQAKRAEGRSSDALEAYFLCVVLGFRGDFRDTPQKLDEWFNAAQARIINSQPQRWGQEPPDAEPVTNVPPRHGREALQRMLMIGAAIFLILIPGVVIAAIFKYAQ